MTFFTVTCKECGNVSVVEAVSDESKNSECEVDPVIELLQCYVKAGNIKGVVEYVLNLYLEERRKYLDLYKKFEEMQK